MEAKRRYRTVQQIEIADSGHYRSPSKSTFLKQNFIRKVKSPEREPTDHLTPKRCKDIFLCAAGIKNLIPPQKRI